jgi:dihydroneopterin aldolase
MVDGITGYPNRIIMKGMKFWSYSGVLEFEKNEGQEFGVNLTLGFLDLKAGHTDLISDTVDYGQVFAVVRGIVEERKFDLIEAMAETIASEVLTRFQAVDALEIGVRKPNAPVEGCFDYMEARLFRERRT